MFLVQVECRESIILFIINEDGSKKSLPIHQIDNIYVFGSLDMNTDFLRLLNQHNVCMHIFNYYGFYSGSFVPRQTKVSGFSKIQQANHYLNQDKRLFLAKQSLKVRHFIC